MFVCLGDYRFNRRGLRPPDIRGRDGLKRFRWISCAFMLNQCIAQIHKCQAGDLKNLDGPRTMRHETTCRNHHRLRLFGSRLLVLDRVSERQLGSSAESEYEPAFQSGSKRSRFHIVRAGRLAQHALQMDRNGEGAVARDNPRPPRIRTPWVSRPRWLPQGFPQRAPRNRQGRQVMYAPELTATSKDSFGGMLLKPVRTICS